MWPARPIARAYLLRGAATWLGARGLVSMAFALGQVDPIHISFSAAMQIVAIAVALGAIDVRRRHESALLANLGVRRRMLFALLALPAVAGELVLGVAFRAVP